MSEADVRSDAEASIRAGAALIREQMIDGDVTRALRVYGGDSFGHAIERELARGIDGRDDAGDSRSPPAAPMERLAVGTPAGT